MQNVLSASDASALVATVVNWLVESGLGGSDVPELLAGLCRRLNAGGGVLAPAVVLRGQVVGTWRRTLGRDDVTIALRLFDQPARRDRDLIADAASRYAAFLGLRPSLVVSDERG